MHMTRYLILFLLYSNHIHICIKHLHKLLSCDTDCPEMLSLIRFIINSLDTVGSVPLYPIYSNKYHISNSPSNFLMNADNNNVFDILNILNYISLTIILICIIEFFFN